MGICRTKHALTLNANYLNKKNIQKGILETFAALHWTQRVIEMCCVILPTRLLR